MMFNYSLKKNYKFFITVFITILCFLTTLISVGFGALNTSLTISGDIEYDAHDDSPTLYNVLKNEARLGTYAKQYTGSHHDSFVEDPTKNIYHWYLSNSSLVDAILDKSNVLFAGFCWQMYRTTDTGGVKLIYNGLPSSGRCNNSGSDQLIGTTKFNSSIDSLAYSGYMFNTIYKSKYKQTKFISVYTRTDMNSSTNYYYGTGVSYNSSTNKYTLSGVTQDTWRNKYASSSGLYTCASSIDTSCSTVYYITGGILSQMYGFPMKDGHLLNYYNTNIIFGTGYTENNGTFTLNGTTSISKVDWYTNYSSYKYYYTCGDTSTNCTNLYFVTSVKNYSYNTLQSLDNYYYANSFTYNSSTGTYTLSNDKILSWEFTDNDMNSLSTHHYTCFNTTGQCNKLSYIYDVDSPKTFVTYLYFIDLENGKSVENAKNEMLYNDNVNQTDSTIKSLIDDWYQTNMTSYTSKLEDTIFCGNRKMRNETANGWNPNGGSIKTNISFDNNKLQCQNDIDKYSVSNNKAKLRYPVGLANYYEMVMLGRVSIVSTDSSFWLISPRLFSNEKPDICTASGSSIGGSSINTNNGIRPVISLKPGTEYASGTGTRDNPYVVE